MEDDKTNRWFYISFADDDGFLGGTYVRGRNASTAVLRATFLGINPGGEALIIEVPTLALDENVPGEKREVLLSKDQLDEVEA